MDINDLYEQAATLSIEQLEAEVLARDLVVQGIRSEMAEVQRMLEPKRIQKAAANSGPAHLKQNIKG